MKLPKIKFIDGLDKQAEYLCFLAKAIQQGHYQELGFLVLPYPAARNRASVYFPNLAYSSNFWQKISRQPNRDLGKKFPGKCFDEIQNLLKKTRALTTSPPSRQATINYWHHAEKDFFRLTQEFLDTTKMLAKIDKIEVLLTKFGTCGSFYPHKEKQKIKIMATLRDDFPPAELARTLLLCFYRLKINQRAQTGLVWQTRKAAVDFLFEETCFKQFFGKQQTRSENLDDQKADRLVSQSQNYLKVLGFPPNSVLSLTGNGKILIEGKQNLLFTDQEQKILKVLIENREQAVSFDQLAEVVWEKNPADKFSLYALAKSIQNIRCKFRQAGIYKNLIVTVRKHGYALND